MRWKDRLERQHHASSPGVWLVFYKAHTGASEFMAKDLDGNLFRVFYDFGTPESGNDA
jgi:hypothetical protein